MNSAGYLNDEEYVLADSRPLLAVIGDSYVDGMGVGSVVSCVGRLQSLLGPSRRVYSFSAAGSPLSQYIRWIREARSYSPDWYAILVVENDIDESVYQLAQGILPSGTPEWERYHWTDSVPPRLRPGSPVPYYPFPLLRTYLLRGFPIFYRAELLFANLMLALDPMFDCASSESAVGQLVLARWFVLVTLDVSSFRRSFAILLLFRVYLQIVLLSS